jgi:hypothetical protein
MKQEIYCNVIENLVIEIKEDQDNEQKQQQSMNQQQTQMEHEGDGLIDRIEQLETKVFGKKKKQTNIYFKKSRNISWNFSIISNACSCCFS